VQRTLLDRGFDLRLSDAFRAAYDAHAGVTLDLGRDELVAKLGEFFADRLRGLLSDRLPADVVLASLPVASDRPLDVRARATAIAELDAATRARVGEVFKRATNIADKAPAGEPAAPSGAGVHPSEVALHEGYIALRERLARDVKSGAYAAAFAAVADFAPRLHQYFLDVFVMTDDVAVRDNRLRLMRAISETCASLAKLEVLGEAPRAAG
jgi:glycyl-tRNA synthetase beta chain